MAGSGLVLLIVPAPNMAMRATRQMFAVMFRRMVALFASFFHGAAVVMRPEHFAVGLPVFRSGVAVAVMGLVLMHMRPAYQGPEVLDLRVVFKKLTALQVKVPAMQDEPPFFHSFLHPREGEQVLQRETHTP